MVVGVIGAAAPSSCTSVTITRVTQEATKLVVEYQGYKARGDETRLAAFFSPYASVTLAASELEVLLREVPAQ